MRKKLQLCIKNDIITKIILIKRGTLMVEIVVNLLAATWMPVSILMLMGKKVFKQRACLTFLVSIVCKR